MYTALRIVSESDEACRRMTVADYAPAKLDNSHLPEFSFTKPKGRRIARRWAGEQPEPITAYIGPLPPPMITRPRAIPRVKVRTKDKDGVTHEKIITGDHPRRKLDSREEAWLNLRPLTLEKRPIKITGFVAPINALEGMDKFLARVEAIARITDQQERDRASHRVRIEQDKELPEIVDEFRANGFRAISLSSSALNDDDDDLEAANYAEKNLHVVPYLLDPVTIAPLLRRIEWEREDSLNGPTVGIRVDTTGPQPEGVDLHDYDKNYISDEEASEMLDKLLAAMRAEGFETPLSQRRARAEYYGAIGSLTYGVKRAPQFPELTEQSMDELGIEDMWKPDISNEGEKELGLHGGADDEPTVDVTWGSKIHVKGARQGVIPDEQLLIGYTRSIVQDRDTEDQFSFSSRLWEDEETGSEF